jgi:phosphonate transport system permease protein
LFNGIQWILNRGVAIYNWGSGVGGWSTLEPFAQGCVPTDAEYYGMALTKLAESIYLAFMATFFAVPVAFVLAFFAARNLTRHSALARTAYMLVRVYINVTRSIEPIIWAILFAVWIGIGPFAGSIALMIHSISSLMKQYSEAIESVDDGPIEALAATGANRVATAWFAVVPQVILPYLAFTIYRWDINVRMATIIGLVGGGGIGGLLIQEQGLANWSRVGTIAFLIFVVVWSMDFLSARVREAIQ